MTEPLSDFPTPVPPPSSFEKVCSRIPILGWIVAVQLQERRQAPKTKHILEQVKTRTQSTEPAWGDDPRRRSVARAVSQAIQQEFGWPNASYLPDDPINLLMCWGFDREPLFCLIDMENRLGLGRDSLVRADFRDLLDLTLGQFVDRLIENCPSMVAPLSDTDPNSPSKWTAGKSSSKPKLLPTVPPQSAWFFPAITLGPVALIFLLTLIVAPADILTWSVWAWVVVLAGVGSLFECIAALRMSYSIVPEGIVRRGIFRRDLLKWQDVQAVGRQPLYSRGVGTCLILFLYGTKLAFRPALDPADATSFLQFLTAQCPQAIQIDEVEGTFDIPPDIDRDRVRTLIAHHTRRLRRQHGFVISVYGLILIPMIITFWNALQAWTFSWADGKIVLICLVAFALLSAQHWLVLWRLRCKAA